MSVWSVQRITLLMSSKKCWEPKMRNKWSKDPHQNQEN